MNKRHMTHLLFGSHWLSKLPDGYKFVPVRPTTRIRRYHWWLDPVDGDYMRVLPRDYGQTQDEANKPWIPRGLCWIAGRLLRVGT